MELARNGRLADLMETGAIVKTAFCGPCFGAGDTPANNAFSIRHSTRNFPNREGSKLQNGQISSLHLWMQGQSQLQQLTRASLQQLQIVMLNSQAQHITLTAIYMLTGI